MLFEDRTDAGRKLGQKLKAVLTPEPALPLILGIPRGGIQIATAASSVTGWPRSFIVTRKLRTPSQPELAFGAVSELGEPWLNEDVLRSHGIDRETIDREVTVQREECRRRRQMLTRLLPCPTLAGVTAIVVDDGVATGATMIAALKQARNSGAAKVICAVPVYPDEMRSQLLAWCDQLVALHHPAWFSAVGEFYAEFPQLTDMDIEHLAGIEKGVSRVLEDGYHRPGQPTQPAQEHDP